MLVAAVLGVMSLRLVSRGTVVRSSAVAPTVERDDHDVIAVLRRQHVALIQQVNAIRTVLSSPIDLPTDVQQQLRLLGDELKTVRRSISKVSIAVDSVGFDLRARLAVPDAVTTELVRNLDEDPIGFWKQRWNKYGVRDGSKHGFLFSGVTREQFSELIRWVCTVREVRGGHVVNDIGAGTGYPLSRMHQMFNISGAGVDLVPDLISLAHTQNPETEMYVARADNNTLPTMSSDFSMMMAVLPYLQNPQTLCRALLELIRVTRRGGHIVIVMIRNNFPGRISDKREIAIYARYIWVRREFWSLAGTGTFGQVCGAPDDLSLLVKNFELHYDCPLYCGDAAQYAVVIDLAE
jgi:SAM-dependent methyltransferase